MFKRRLIKSNKIKRFLLKILNLHAVDKETFNLMNPYIKNEGQNFFKFNEKSYILSNGFLNLDRKINNLDIYFRFSPAVALWNSPKSWKRIIPNINKKILIKTCLLSLKESLINFLSINRLEVNLNLISDSLDNEFDNDLINLIKNDKFKTNLIVSKIKGNHGSYLECCNNCKNAKDLIFFVEDDYLFKENAIDELLITYSRISTLLKNDIFLCPTDYPFYYDSDYNTALFIGKKLRWRYVNETLLTFLLSKKLFNKHKKNMFLVGEQNNEPFEKPIHEIFKSEKCLSPISSVAYHLSRTVPGIENDWIKLWNKYYKKVNGGP
tara:strand:+ start:353 stop:1321 length:969 start_codon:yes stop_codon:yes gene_type:complete